MEGLSRVGKRYVYRRRIPSDLVTTIGRREVKKSLRTSRFAEAVKLARVIAAELDRTFTEARLMSKLDQQTFQKLIARHYNSRLDKAEQRREQIEHNNPMQWNDDPAEMTLERIIASPNGINAVAAVHEALAKSRKQKIATGAYRESDQLQIDADKLLADAGISIDRESPEYTKLLRHLALADADADQVNADRYHGDYMGPVEIAATSKYPSSNGKLFLDVLEEFLEFKSNSQSTTTATGYRANCSIFAELMGNRPVDDYVTHDIVIFREKLKKLPTTRADKLNGIPLTTLIEMDLPEETERFSVRNVNKYLERTIAVFDYACGQGYTPRQIGRGTKTKVPRSLVKARSWRPYTPEDLQLVFFKLIIHRRVTPHIGWMPLLGLYTGARRGELAKLRVDKLMQVNGIWCFDIQTEYDEGDAGPKTEASRRFIPLHPVLMDCGILEFVEQRRKDKKATLFDLVAENYGKQFGRVKDKLPDPTRKAYHSFRSTFTNELKQAKVHPDLYNAIIGHAPSNDLDDNYTEDYSVENKYEAILELDTFGMDRDKLVNTYKIYLPIPPRRKRNRQG